MAGPIVIIALLIILSLGLLLWAMSKDHYLAGFFKLMASTGFIALCIASGGVHSPYGWVILAGLACSWWGDMFLISRNPKIFMLGLVAFFTAHVAYCVAFFIYGIGLFPVVGALVLCCIPAVVLIRWLNPHLGKMRIPVYAYMLVISVMLSMATGATLTRGGVLIIAGAFLFYCSDIFVARDRFVSPGKENAYIGLPLYYGGQILFALTPLYCL